MMWNQAYRKNDAEAGARALYPMMLEPPEMRWAFIRKIYSIVAIQLLATIAVAATVVTVRPIAHFFVSTGAGLALYIVLIITPFITLIPLYFYHQRHPVNYLLLGVFTVSLAFAVGLTCAFTSGKVILESVILTTVVVVALTIYTFWAARRGHDFNFLGPFLFGAVLVLMVFALIQILQDSLIGSAVKWYMQLSRDQIHSWNDLVNAFLAQYQHVVDEASDRMTLLNLKKKATESFKKYAQRWRDLASQVQPLLTEKKITKIFVNSLKRIYHDKMIGNATKNFADMVISGELIEISIKNGLVEDNLSSKKAGSTKKKEGEVQAVQVGFQPSYVPYPFYPGYAPHYPTVNNVAPSPYVYQPPKSVAPLTSTQLQQNNHFGNRAPRPKSQFDPISCTYTELFPQLVANNKVTSVQLPPLQPLYPKWYDSNAHCDYHSGAAGHTTENCTGLKYKVRDLIKRGELRFEITYGLNVNANPLPNHAGAK